MFRGEGGRRIAAMAAAALIAASLLLVTLAVATSGAASQRTIRGTAKADTLVGTQGADTMYGLAGKDWLRGLGGNDVLVGGPGRDTVSGGAGNDRIAARDQERDKIFCGLGKDRAVVDANDSVYGDCESVSRPQPPEPVPPPPTGQRVVQVDQSWTCTGHVELDLVKVTLNAGANAQDAIYLRKDCNGWILRIEIETATADGVKINAPAPAAHDLVIWGGYIRCFGHDAGAHQDGVQALGGERVTFRNVEINCNSQPNAQFFVSAAQSGMPTDVVCERCFLGSGAATTLLIGGSVRSGAKSSLLCPGRFRNVAVSVDAVDPIGTGNTVLPATDARCSP